MVRRKQHLCPTVLSIGQRLHPVQSPSLPCPVSLAPGVPDLCGFSMNQTVGEFRGLIHHFCYFLASGFFLKLLATSIFSAFSLHTLSLKNFYLLPLKFGTVQETVQAETQKLSRQRYRKACNPGGEVPSRIDAPLPPLSLQAAWLLPTHCLVAEPSPILGGGLGYGNHGSSGKVKMK